jgi:SAM-dependent methyltransferase
MRLNNVTYIVNNDWLERDKSTRMDFFKEIIYFFMRPLLSAYSCRHLTKETIEKFKPAFVLPERGIPPRTRRLWALRLSAAQKATILLQGVGTGWEVLSWARMSPKKIIGVDLVSFSKSWDEISHYCQEKYSVQVEFRQAPLEDLAFLKNCSIDLCASENVYEHCRDLNSVLRESFRVLKPGGILYAAYGPLWFSSGGDHFSTRGGIGNSFNHLLLSSEEYADFINKFSKEQEDCQDGRRYIEIDLFSKLTTQEYLDLITHNGFKVDKLVIETSSKALAFRKQYPDLFLRLVDNCRVKCSQDDLLLKTNIVYCLKQ